MPAKPIGQFRVNDNAPLWDVSQKVERLLGPPT
jgi:hypothetical protein